MGFYAQVIVPLLCDFGLDRPFVARYRRELLAHASGNILEIGFGTGLNLPCYPPQVRKLTTVDPNVGMYRRARRRIKQARIEVDRRVLGGEKLPFEDGTFDCIVSTFTLCSIKEVAQALREVYRVLKAGGLFLFLEHGLSPEPKVQKWQHRLNWLQMRLAGGCHLNRDMRALVTAQPFASVQMDEFYIEKTPQDARLYVPRGGHEVSTPRPHEHRHRPDVRVGSSRGGAVAMNINGGNARLVLLCPAWRKHGTAKTVKPGAVILHSRADDLVPFADSEELVRNSGLPASALVEVGDDHRLADPEPLRKLLEACEGIASLRAGDVLSQLRPTRGY